MTTEYGREDGRASSNATNTSKAARRYIRQGLSIIPVPPRLKSPGRDDWQNERWTIEDIPQLWRNGEGIGVLWGEPSGGRVDCECDWPEARIAAAHILLDTRTWGRKGSPASHRSYLPTDRVPNTKRYKIPGNGPGRMICELLSTGAQSLVPPSLHESGEERVWYDERPTTEVLAAELEEGMVDVASAALIARKWPGQGIRHDYVNAASGYLGRHLSRERTTRIMEAAIEASGARGADEEAHKRYGNIETTLDKLARGEAVTGGGELQQLCPGLPGQLARWHRWNNKEREASGGDGDKDGPPTDDELRDRFLGAHPDYGFGLGEWRRYSGGVWPKVDEVEVLRRVVGVLEDAKPEEVRPTKHLMRSVSELARVQTAVPDRLWDADPNILVCENGALDLTTRKLLPHSKEHYATEAVPYAYDEDAQSDAWVERVMGEVITPNLGLETVAFLQEFCGYCLTTDTSHEISLWFSGKHGGGRSTILAGMQAMLGPRAGILSLSDVERSSFALTNLPGKTLMTATEQPGLFLRGGGKLNAIISGECIQVDLKFKDPIEVVPRCKVAWAMNELPRFRNSDDGIFRRVKILELPEIPQGERDPEVKRSVEGSGAAILNWALTGLDRLRERGRFEIPEKVRTATDEWRQHNDVPAMFVDEKCETGEGFHEKSSYLYDVYKEWCLDNGHKPLSSTNVAGEWRRLGFERERVTEGTRWQGVKLRSRGESDFRTEGDGKSGSG